MGKRAKRSTASGRQKLCIGISISTTTLMAIAWIGSIIAILDIPYKLLRGSWKKAKTRQVLAGFIFGFSSCVGGLYFFI